MRFSIPLVIISRLKADFFAEFSLDRDGITVYHQKHGVHKILWTEVVDSGILEKHYYAEPLYHPRFVYFSKRKLLEKDRLQFTDCRDKVLFAVQEFFPINTEIKRVDVPRNPSSKDLEE